MAFNTKIWKNQGETGADENNSVLNKNSMNDLETRIKNALNETVIKKTITANDFDNLINEGTGLFVMYGPCQNAPSNDNNKDMHWYVLQNLMDTRYCVQLSIALHTDIERIYMRHRINNSWSEWISVSQAGTYSLSGMLSIASGEIELCDSINNYDYLIIATGGVSDGTYVQSIVMPFVTEYQNGKITRASWRIGIDIPTALTANGKISFDILSTTKLRIKTNTNNANVRGIFGVKLY